MKCQGQACNLEVQICWGITWNRLLEIGLVEGSLEPGDRYGPVRSGSLRWSMNPKDLVCLKHI